MCSLITVKSMCLYVCMCACIGVSISTCFLNVSWLPHTYMYPFTGQKLYRLFIYIFMFLYIHLSDTFSIFHTFYYFKFSLQISFFSRYLQIYCHKARGMTNSISYKFTFLFPPFWSYHKAQTQNILKGR